MTGGTALAGHINRNLARMCNEFGFGFALGSCRKLIEDPSCLGDFDVRSILGDSLPLFANLGIAQIESWSARGELFKIEKLLRMLQADGLVIHLNPLQEWMQPEGDRFGQPPIDTIGELLQEYSLPLIVKEVGQGMGPASLRSLMQLPLEAVEFGAFGGTNFSTIESQRSSKDQQVQYEPLTQVGHAAQEMLAWVNECVENQNTSCKSIIISGGVRNYLDGFYYLSKSKIKALYGHAGSFLRHAQGDYSALQNYARGQVEGLMMAKQVLRIKE